MGIYVTEQFRQLVKQLAATEGKSIGSYIQEQIESGHPEKTKWGLQP